MASNITDVASFDDPVQIPDDGETADSASLLLFVQALANRDEFLRTMIESALLDVSAQSLSGTNELRNLLRMHAASAALGAAADVTGGAGFPTYADPLNAIVANATRFLAVGEPDVSESNLRAMYSLDGITWTAITAANGTEGLNAIATGAGNFCAGGDSGRVVLFNSFGSYVSDTAISGTPTIHAMAYGNSYWVAATSSGLWYSSDAVTWTQHSYNTGVNKPAVAFGNGYFVFSDASSGVRYLTDPTSGTTTDIPSFPAVDTLAFGDNIFIGTLDAADDVYVWNSTTPDPAATAAAHGTAFTGTRVFYLESLGVFAFPVTSAASGVESNLLLSCDGRRFASIGSNLAVVGAPPTYAGMAAGPLASDIAGLPIIVGESSGAPVVHRGNRAGLNVPRASY